MEYDNLNLNLYRIFYAAAKSKTINEAAEKLHVSQPAVSKQLKKLEEDLNNVLFYRTSQGITLTTEGIKLLEYVEKSYSLLIAGQRVMSENKKFDKGTILIGAPTHITSFYLFEIIEKFKEAYPNVKIKLFSGSTDFLIRELIHHRVDFVIDSSPIEYSSSDLIIEPLKTFNTCFVASKNLIDSKNFENFEDYDFVMPHSKSNVRKNLLKSLKEKNIDINIFLEVDTTELIIEAVKKSLGVGYVVKSSVIEDLKSNLLCEINTLYELPVIEVNLIYIPKYLTNISEYFINSYLKK